MTPPAMPRFADDLMPMTHEDYDGVIGRYVDRCSRLPGVRAIYQFGSIGAPGVSDLDLVVVVDRTAVQQRARLEVLSIEHASWKADEVLARCFIHDVLVCDREVFRHIAWLIVGSEMRLVAGEAVDVVRPEPSTLAYIELVQGLDFCVARVQELAWSLARSSLSKRWLIPQLWSITHTAALLERAGRTLSPSWSELMAAVRAMRSRAGATADEELYSIAKAVEAHFAAAAGTFLDELVGRGDLVVDGGERTCAISVPEVRTVNVYRASDAGEGASAVAAALLTRQLRLGRRRVTSAWTHLSAPMALLHHHLAYLHASEQHAPIGRRIARCARIPDGARPTSEYQDVVRRRMALVDANTSGLREAGLAFGRITIPGLPCRPLAARSGRTRRQRAVSALLDWRLLPIRTVAMAPIGQ